MTPHNPALAQVSAGFRTRLDGKSIEENPSMSEAACSNWDRGWHEADEKLKKVPREKEKV